MARIKIEKESAVNQDVREIFDEIIERVGKVPAAYRAFALHPHILQANWNRTKNIIGKGNVAIETKEAIATRISKVNGCHFCLSIHKSNLEKLGLSISDIASIETGEVDDQRLYNVLNFVSTATKNPELLSDSDFDQLKSDGYSESDILEILTVMEMYTGYNKIIVALNLQNND